MMDQTAEMIMVEISPPFGVPHEETVVPVPYPIVHYAFQRGMYIYQLNSQRFMGPTYTLSTGWQPLEGSEVFVGGLPRFWGEPQLMPFLEQIGPIFQLRLMMTFSGCNKGFCFVKFMNPWIANEAVAILNGVVVDGYRSIFVAKSVDNKKLALSGVPTDLSSKQIFQKLEKLAGGLIWLEPSWVNQSPLPAKGVAFATYESHRAAALARKAILEKSGKLWNDPITVHWADPYPAGSLSSELYPQVLHVTNLSSHTKNKLLWQIFSRSSYGGVKHVRRVSPTEAYIRLRSRRQAERAMVALNMTTVYGNNIQVHWAEHDYVNQAGNP